MSVKDTLFKCLQFGTFQYGDYNLTELPLPEWLRGPLKEWAEDLLLSQKIKNQNY